MPPKIPHVRNAAAVLIMGFICGVCGAASAKDQREESTTPLEPTNVEVLTIEASEEPYEQIDYFVNAIAELKEKYGVIETNSPEYGANLFLMQYNL